MVKNSSVSRSPAPFFVFAALLLVGAADVAGITGDGDFDEYFSGDSANDSYFDEFLSGPVRQQVTGIANARDLPTAQGSTVQGQFREGDLLAGRWVKGVDPSARWFRTNDGYYVWEGNLRNPY